MIFLLLSFLSSFANPQLEKTWHTEPSPLLLKELQAFAQENKLRDELALSVYSVRHQRFEARWNDTGWFVPASCIKLVVTAAALDAFPVNHYPTTTLEVAGSFFGRTLRGDLRAIGGGDPNISDRFFPDALMPLRAWADSLKGMGIDTIRGRVVVSDSFFAGPRRPAAWQSHHFNTWYGAEVSALSFSDNTVALKASPAEKTGQKPVATLTPDVGYVQLVNKARTVAGQTSRLGVSLSQNSNIITLTGSIGQQAPERVWNLPVRNPSLYFRAALLRVLRAQGIVVIEDPSVPVAGIPLKSFRFTTAPLMQLVEEANQRSQNLHTELLLRHLGKFVLREGSAAAGIRSEKIFLRRLGLDSGAFNLHDGCGLSRENRVKPDQLTLLLARMARHRYGKDYISSLALPGLDGASGRKLNFLSDTDLLRYKTGTISGAQGLCGYLFSSDGDTLAVVILHNGSGTAPAKSARLLDSLFTRTLLWYNKERPAASTAFKLLTRPDVPKGYLERLRYFSKALMGTPYSLGPTGEGRYGDIEPLPLVDLNRFDCVTYLESLVGLALAKQAFDIVPAVLPFRYRGDTLSYATRNHFFVGDWLGNNPKRFRILRLPGDTLVHKTLYKGKLLSNKGLAPPAIDPEVDIPFLPYEQALKLAANWNLGKGLLGVAFVTGIAGLDVTHTGLVDAESGIPVLRHAGQLKGMVAEVDFKEYLEARRGKCAGVLFFDFLPYP